MDLDNLGREEVTVTTVIWRGDIPQNFRLCQNGLQTQPLDANKIAIAATQAYACEACTGDLVEGYPADEALAHKVRRNHTRCSLP